MLGLFGTLNLATRSLSTQRQGTEITGHNLANVNNPAYARQRLAISTSLPVPSEMGPQGTGAEGVAIIQLRNDLIDRQILSETSVKGSLTAQQSALQYAQANLGQQIDRQAAAGGATGVSGQNGIAGDLSSLFNSFQSLSTNPTSTAERQVLLMKAQDLSTQFNQVSKRLGDVNTLLNDSVNSDVNTANNIVGEISKLNEQIVRIENGGGEANDLRDIRQQRLEDLGRMVNISTTEQPSGALDVSIDGIAMTSGGNVLERLETYDGGSGQLFVRAQNAGVPLNITGGSIHGTIDARDGALSSMRGSLDTLASELISQVNAVHQTGYGLSGSTGEVFFEGTDAATMKVNANLVADPTRIQASGVSGATGDNQVALAIAQLANKPIGILGNQTFSQNYGQTVARLGESLAGVNTQLDNQDIVEKMLIRQRDSVSGVSLDEEMTDLIRFQKAFEASARLVSLVDEMLDTVVNMKR